MSTTTYQPEPRSHTCPRCGALVVSPLPRRCPTCAATFAAAASANELRGPTALDEHAESNPETVTIQVGHQDSVVYLPDDSPSRAAAVPATVVGPKASLSHVGMEGGVTLEHPSASLERIATGSTTTLPTQKARSGTGSATVSGATVDELLTQRPGEEKYVVAGEIARGGMGVILRAVDRDIRRDVAMKILLTDQQDHARQRFVEEAQIAGQLEHPNIVPVHDLGVDNDGRLFFTMKLVKGKSLAEILDQQRTPAVAAVVQADPTAAPEHSLTRMLGIYLSVLNAIAFAHDRGVIHRDLKPANLMVGDFGEVLVMDWGLAKVAVGRTGSAKQWTHQHVRATNLGQLAAGKGVGRKSLVMPDPHRPLATDERLKVLVEGFASQGGEVDGKLIEGTPAYMAPEQARGALSEVDERSDIYSLGAILYELLTLSPPVRGRQVRTILDDVIAGRILAPQSRAPERTIPPELSAIALKALARDKADRYQSVLALRSDIELYLDDRQVSAKEDSTWEALVKLMRRNQEVVTAIIVCVLIVVVVTIFLFNAILKERHKYQQSARVAETRLSELKIEQGRRAADQRRAAPALVAKAKRAVDLKDFPEAQADIDLAIQYDPALPEARLLAAQLVIREQDWTAAAIALSAYVQGKPDDADGKLMLGLVRRAGQPNDDNVHRQVDGPGGERSSERLTAIADALVRQGAYTIAESLYQSGRELMLMYRVRLEKQWPGCTKSGFSADKDGKLTITGLSGRADVYDLSALEGLPIAYLSLAHTKALDITPLKRMPLISLDLTDTPVRNLEPLAGLPLTVLRLANTRVVDLTSLASLPLEELDLTDTAVADLNSLERLPLTTLRITRTRVQDLAVLVGMPLTTLSMAGTRVQDLVPLKGLKLAELDATGTLVADLAPLRGMRLTSLRLAGTRVTDLRPLQGMPLNELTITGTAIADLEPLKGMALTRLDLSGLPVTDLSPLIGMPLARLDLWRSPLTSIATLQGAQLSMLNLADSRVSDLSPLKGMPLATLDLTNTPVTDLKPLVGTPLTSLILDGTAIADIGPLRLLPLKELRMAGTRITDVRPLSDAQGAGHSLERLILPPKIERGLDGLRRLTSLQRIGGRWEGSWDKVPAAADFWRLQATAPVRPAP